MVKRAWGVAGSVALSSLISGVGHAQSAVFDVPAGCGSELSFHAELERLTGADVARATPSTLRITRDEASHEYRLTLEVGGRTRELTHADCQVLFRSALVIAAASVRAEPEPEPPPTPAPPAPAPSASPASKPDALPPPRGPTVRASAALGGGAAFGVVPHVTAVVEARGGLVFGSWGFTLAGRYFPARRVSTEGRGADISGFGFRAAGSVSPIPLLSISAGMDADWLSGSGDSGIASPDTDHAWTLAPSLELALIPFKNEHLALEVAVEARIALQRPSFEVTGFRELYQVPRLGVLPVARGVWLFP